MEQFLEKVMNFINENTMLLILICIFLIIILVIYLIDNTIKTKKLEQEELNKTNNSPEPTVLNNNPDNKAETPVVEEPVVAEKEVETPVVEETAVAEKEAETEEVKEEPIVPIEEIDSEVSEPVKEEAPVFDSNIDELLNKDYTGNNEVVNNLPVEEPKKDVFKTKYTNDKKLSDIFGKKEEPTVRHLETTQDFSDELDRILQKLNGEETKIEDESIDYTNMF